MKSIYLNCVLMDNREIIFNGKSLGFLTIEEIENYAFTKSQLALILKQ